MNSIIKKIETFVLSDDKFFLISEVIKIAFCGMIYPFRFRRFGKNSKIEKPDRIIGGKRIEIGRNVEILKHARMEVISRWGDEKLDSSISIGDNTSIGQNFHVSSAGKLVIGKDVVISGNVLITNIEHEYERKNIRILEQGLKVRDVEIGDNCFIGYGAVIQAGVKMGKQCIIGSNAVVRNDVPDYSVVVGVPGKVVKNFF